MQSIVASSSSLAQPGPMYGMTEQRMTLNTGPLSINSMEEQTRIYLRTINRPRLAMDEVHREMYRFVNEQEWPPKFNYAKIVMWYNIINHHKQFCRLTDHFLDFSGLPRPEGLSCAEFDWSDTIPKLPPGWNRWYPFGLAIRFSQMIHSHPSGLHDAMGRTAYLVHSSSRYLGYAVYYHLKTKGLEESKHTQFEQYELILTGIAKGFFGLHGIDNPVSPSSWLSIREALDSVSELGSYTYAQGIPARVEVAEANFEEEEGDNWVVI